LLKKEINSQLIKTKMQGIDINKADVAASFQQSVVEVLVDKSVKATKFKGLETLCLAGGVAANSALRAELSKRCEKERISFLYPPNILCTDNAAMIACAGYYEYICGRVAKLSINAVPSLKIGQRIVE
jgi:N6-L-threonylcarbamoyladenine synthase